MVDKTPEVVVKSIKDWRSWLKKNHLKEKKVFLISYKKHTGEKSISHKEAMFEAIAFGWIDTTIKKIDEERYGRYFAKRNKNSKWSDNTLSYGKKLFEENRMSKFGEKMYLEGKSKKTHDHGMPKNPTIKDCPELGMTLQKNKKAKENFENLAPSYKKTYLRWLLSAKLPETKKKRISHIVKHLTLNKKSVF